MDITYQYYLDKISKNPNKSNWRIRNMIRLVDLAISGYRITAMKSNGYLREFCNKEANYLENRLKIATNKPRVYN